MSNLSKCNRQFSLQKATKQTLFLVVLLTLQACASRIPGDFPTISSRYDGYWQADVLSANPRQEINGLTLVCPSQPFRTSFGVYQGKMSFQSNTGSVQSQLLESGEFENKLPSYAHLVEVAEHGMYLTNTKVTPVLRGKLSRWGTGHGTYTLAVGSLNNEGCTANVQFSRLSR